MQKYGDKMKTLYESIISSNKAGLLGVIKDLISLMSEDNEELKKLNELWNKCGLGIPGFEWSFENSILCFSEISSPKNTLIYRPSMHTPGYDIFIHKYEPVEKMLEKMKIKIDDYPQKICRILGAHITSSKKSTIFINIKFD